MAHQSVLFDEALAALNIKPDGIYIDGTFGRGGHTRAILQQLDASGRVYAFDRDPEAVSHAREMLAEEPRFVIAQAPFSELSAWCQRWSIMGKVDGLLLDIGVSSPQLDNPERGFSFRANGPLDMRMDPSAGQSAADWLAAAPEQEIAGVIKTFGEERFARRIARAIVTARASQAIETTRQLADIVAKAHPAWEKGKDPATRTFQAIRIFINRELEELQSVLLQALDVLAVGGRLVVISFHSLEDRIVKQFIQQQVSGDSLPLDVPIEAEKLNIRLRKLGKMIRPGEAEVRANPRARSARLRVAERVA